MVGPEGRPADYSVDLCLQVVAYLKQALKLGDLKGGWVPDPTDRVGKLVKRTVTLECGPTTITFGRMERVAFSRMVFVDGGTLLATAVSGLVR